MFSLPHNFIYIVYIVYVKSLVCIQNVERCEDCKRWYDHILTNEKSNILNLFTLRHFFSFSRSKENNPDTVFTRSNLICEDNMLLSPLQRLCSNAGSSTGVTSGSMGVSASTRQTAGESWSNVSASRRRAWTWPPAWNVAVMWHSTQFSTAHIVCFEP